jgi:hypothetical protein
MTIRDFTPEFLQGILCALGIHAWESEPRIKEQVRLVGPDILFWTWGRQDGTRFCTQCDASQRVERSGLVGMGSNGDQNEWIPKKEQR